MTPLAEALVARIRAGGPMTVADYMTACLADPRHGYYTTREPFGRGGDFTTAPEISQMFGELIGLWTLATWQAMGSPSPFVLAELGPGRGTLMADALRAAAVRPAFGAAMDLHLVEISPRLRTAQRAALAASGLQPTWHETVASLPAGPYIVIANEFFDALPIRQFVRTPAGWTERMVGLGDDGGLAFGLRPHDGVGGVAADAPEGAVRETSAVAIAIMDVLAERLAHAPGAILAIDYGYDAPAFGDTLQAVRAHRYDDPLAAPGEADITAHVDFGALANVARQAGAEPRRLMTQGEFLPRLGLRERAETLGRGKDTAVQADIASQAGRLAGETGMGALFKVLAISSPGLALPAFDGDS